MLKPGRKTNQHKFIIVSLKCAAPAGILSPREFYSVKRNGGTSYLLIHWRKKVLHCAKNGLTRILFNIDLQFILTSVSSAGQEHVRGAPLPPSGQLLDHAALSLETLLIQRPETNNIIHILQVTFFIGYGEWTQRFAEPSLFITSLHSLFGHPSAVEVDVDWVNKREERHQSDAHIYL